MDKNKHPYLVPVAVMLTLGAVIVVVLCLLFAERAEEMENLDDEKVAKLKKTVEKLFSEALAQYEEAIRLDAGDPDQNNKRQELFEQAYQKCERAMEFIERIERYYEEQGKEPPPWDLFPLQKIPDSFDIPPHRPPLEPPYQPEPQRDG